MKLTPASSYPRGNAGYSPQSYNEGSNYRSEYQRPDPTLSRSDVGAPNSTSSYSSPSMGSEYRKEEIPLARRDSPRPGSRSRPNPLATPARSSGTSDRRGGYSSRKDAMNPVGPRRSNAQSSLSPVAPNEHQLFEYSPAEGEPSTSMSEGHRVKSPDNLLSNHFWESIDQEELITSHSSSSRSRKKSSDSELIPNPKWTEK